MPSSSFTITAPPRPPRAAGDPRFVFLTIGLGLALAVGITMQWAAAFALVVVVLALAFRPLEPFPAFVLVTVVAGFVSNEGGHLTRELSVLSLLIGYALFSMLVARTTGRWALPRASLITAVMVFEGWTFVCAALGIAAGNSVRFMGLELLPLLALTLALMVGGMRLAPRDLRLAFVALALASLGHVGLGVVSYAVNRVRAGGIWFTPVPGLMALLIFNLALRTERRSVRLGMAVLVAANLLHQLISLTRGYWMGVVFGLLLSVLLYVRRGPGVGQRWRRTLVISGSLVLMVTVAAIAAGAYFGWGSIGSLLSTRLASTVGTQQSGETASNVARLIEWVVVARHIATAPWLGHGMGYTINVHDPILHRVTTQWFIHEQYLWIWLKQGLIGLICLLSVLWAAIVTGIRGAQRLDDEGAAWSSAAAAGTVYVAVLGLTNYPIATVNPMYLLGLLWGVALSLSRPPRSVIVWRRPAAPLAPLAPPVS